MNKEQVVERLGPEVRDRYPKLRLVSLVAEYA